MESTGPTRGEALDPATLLAIAAGLGESIPPGNGQPGQSRRYDLLLRTEAYEAWLISWPSGTGLGLHDHGDSLAAINMLSGELQETYLSPDGPVQRVLAPGDHVVLPSDHVHEVVNAGLNEAVSIHVYSPPLQDMSFRLDAGIDPELTGRTSS